MCPLEYTIERYVDHLFYTHRQWPQNKRGLWRHVSPALRRVAVEERIGQLNIKRSLVKVMNRGYTTKGGVSWTMFAVVACSCVPMNTSFVYFGEELSAAQRHAREAQESAQMGCQTDETLTESGRNDARDYFCRGGKGLIIDAANPWMSETMRFVNSAIDDASANMVAILDNRRVHLCAKRLILPGEELLWFYGKSYGIQLVDLFEAHERFSLNIVVKS